MHKKIQATLLGLSTAAAVISTFAQAAPAPEKQAHAQAMAATAAPEEMVSRFIVKPRQASEKLRRALQADDASALSQAANAPLKVARSMSGGAHVLALGKPVRLSDARGIAARLMRDPAVETAEPDRIMRIATTTPTDPGYAAFQWHYSTPNGLDNKGGANLPPAWDVTKGVAGIKVAVIDTGYRPHPDLGTILQGYDFVSDAAIARDGDGRDLDARDEGTYGTAAECGASNAADSSWHGTHLAGTIAALMDNGLGGTGIAPGVKILPVRVLGRCGTGYTSDIIDAMRWAAGLAVPLVPANANPAQVLNLSLGGYGACAASMQSAVNDIVAAGKVIVAAAGNGASTTVISPANCNGVIAVTAHAIDGDNASYADIGPTVALSAPGGGCGFANHRASLCNGLNSRAVYSTSNAGATTAAADNYAFYQGTSMATAHVAGVAALMLSTNATLTPAQTKAYLTASARTHPAGTTCARSAYTGMCGSGLLDAEAALQKTVDLAPIVILANPYQVVTPNASVELSGLASVAAPGTGRSIASYSWTQQSGASVGAMGGINTATATFSAPTTGTYSFKLAVTDSAGRSSSAIATVRVNSPPVLGAVAQQTGTPGSAISFNVTATDADGDPIRFHSVSVPSGATFSATGAFDWPSAGPAGTYTLTYYASDNDANGATGSVTIQVGAAAGSIGSSAASEGGGGGGSLNVPSLFGLALLAAFLRVRRSLQRVAA